MRIFLVRLLILLWCGGAACLGESMEVVAVDDGVISSADNRASCQVLRLDSVGGRFGFGMTQHGAAFHQAEGYLGCMLPWFWTSTSGWRVETTMEGACGGLWDGTDEAVVGSVGPGVKVSPRGLPVFLEGGIDPTFLSFHDFAGRNLGADFQFTSHVGLGWDVVSHVRVEYRFQHMSNAGFSKPNPGLNLHMFCVGYAF